MRRTTERDLQTWLEFALELADEADQIALHFYRREATATRKSDGSFVTEGDTRIEAMLRERILARHPEHRITGEEYGRDGGGDSVRWYLDPIDATHNYMRGIPTFATLIAAEVDDELQFGVVSAPALMRRWYAGRGLGAWTTGGAHGPSPRRIKVSKIDSIPDANLLYRSMTDMSVSRVASGFNALSREVEHATGYGDFWGYALVSEGSAEVMTEQDLGPWDLAAPWVVVEEAGGRITDFDGVRSLERGEGLATNGMLHAAIMDRLHGRSSPRPEGQRTRNQPKNPVDGGRDV